VSKYVLAFRGQPDRAQDPDEGQQWGAWFAGLGTAISDMGNQVGTVRTLRSEHGGDPATEVLTGPGDFIYVPPFVPHQEINANAEEQLSCVVIRSDQEPVVVNLDLPQVEDLARAQWVDSRHPAQ
jgi:uncharacterized RmlC-like cupin family protein